MSTMRKVSVAEVEAMLTRAAAAFGLSYDEFRDIARSGDLVEPELRDLWLIWGDIVERDARKSS